MNAQNPKVPAALEHVSRKEKRAARKQRKKYLKSLPMKDQIIQGMKTPSKQALKHGIAVFYFVSGLLFAANGVLQGVLIAKAEEIPMVAEAFGYVATIVSLGLSVIAIGASIQPKKQDKEQGIVLAALYEKLEDMQKDLYETKRETYEIKNRLYDEGLHSHY